MFEWAGSLVDQGTDLARKGIYLLAIITVGTVWWKMKAAVPVVGAILLSAVVIWGVSKAGQDQLKDKVDKDSKPVSMGPIGPSAAGPLSADVLTVHGGAVGARVPADGPAGRDGGGWR